MLTDINYWTSTPRSFELMTRTDIVIKIVAYLLRGFTSCSKNNINNIQLKDLMLITRTRKAY